MSLDFNYKNVKNADEVMFNENDEMKPLSTAMVYATLVTGINEITEENWKEFYARVHLWEKARGNYVTMGDGTPHFITPEEVKEHIGLKTNVMTHTRHQFLKKVIDTILNDFKWDAGKVKNADV